MSKILKQSVLSKGTACSFKSAIQNYGFGVKKSGFSITKPILMELLTLPLNSWSEKLIDDLAEELIEKRAYEIDAQREVKLKEFKICALRMRDYFVEKKLHILQTNYKMIVDLNVALGLTLETHELEVCADALMEDDRGEVYFIKFGNQSPYLAQERAVSGREEKFFSYSMDMYLLALGANEYAKATGKEASVGQIFLKNKGEKFKDLDPIPKFRDMAHYNVAMGSVNKFLLNPALPERLVALLTEEPTRCNTQTCNDCYYAEICQYVHHVPSAPKKMEEVQSKSSGKVKWTKEQQAFINFEQGICRTNAVAGAGKTSVIANRFIELLKKGYLGETFLLITFTEKGCQELKEKIEYWLKTEGMDETIVDKIKVKTFNGFGNDLIKEYYPLLGYTKEPQLIDTVDMMNIIVELSGKYPPIKGLRYDNPTLHMFNARGAYFEIVELFEVIKKSGLQDFLPAPDLAKELKIPTEVVEMYFEFRQICKERGLIDFTDQIILAGDLVRMKEVQDALRLQHIIIDEVQDTNMMQMQIVKALTKTPYFCSLVVCGDDSQAIYSFQGATQEIILKFDEMFENVVDLTLSNNFRSTKEIAQLANQLNTFNIHRIKKDIVAHKNGLKPFIMDKGMSTSVQEFVTDAIKKGVPLNEIAVIGRNRSQLRALQEHLGSINIPTTLACSEYLYENVPVQRIISLASWLKDDSQELELAKHIQFAEYSSYEAAENPLEWLKKRTEEVSKEWAKKSPEAKYKGLLKVIEQHAKVYPSIATLQKALLTRRNHSLAETLDYLIGIVKFRSDLSLTAPTGEDAVVLTTAHSSKGREFHSVIVLANTFKSFPVPSLKEHIKNNAYDRFDLNAAEEERRLAFVAITRAKEVLAFTGTSISKKSTLLDELTYFLNGYNSYSVQNLQQFIAVKTGGSVLAS